jgi:nucleoside-diphosphate-sugar epimerase
MVAKKILITGGNGYIARNTIPFLSEYDLTILTRQQLDLLNAEKVKEFFKDKRFDRVIHTATYGGYRTQKDDPEWVYNNVTMFYNLMNCQSSFEQIINLTSGAQFDRRHPIDDTRYLHHAFPIDPYGMSKNIISKIGRESNKFKNLVIYNIFNYDEPDSRMIKNNIKRYINKQPLTIFKDRKVDFFFMDDFVTLLKHYIDTDKTLTFELDLCYSRKYYLSEIANIINSLDDYAVDVNIENHSQDLPYIGNGDKLERFNLPLVGLMDGITITYNKILEANNV